MQLMFEIETIVPQIRSEDWFVTIGLKDAYFHISILLYHRKFLRFALGGRAYRYLVLPFCLALSPRTFTKCIDAALAPLYRQGIRIMNYIDDWLILDQSHQLAVRHRDVVLAHMKELGLRLKHQKECAFSTTEDHFSWRGMGLNVDAGTPVTGTYRIHPVGYKSIRLGQSLTVKQFQRLLGLMATASNVIPFGLLYMRPMQRCLRTKGFSPRGNHFSHNQGHAAMLMCLGNVEETLVSVPGSHAGSFMSSQDANDRCLSHGLGRNQVRVCGGTIISHGTSTVWRCWLYFLVSRIS